MRGFVFILDALIALLIFYAIGSITYINVDLTLNDDYIYDNIIGLHIYHGISPMNVNLEGKCIGYKLDNSLLVDCNCSRPFVYYPCRNSEKSAICGIKICEVE